MINLSRHSALPDMNLVNSDANYVAIIENGQASSEIFVNTCTGACSVGNFGFQDLAGFFFFFFCLRGNLGILESWNLS